MLSFYKLDRLLVNEHQQRLNMKPVFKSKESAWGWHYYMIVGKEWEQINN